MYGKWMDIDSLMVIAVVAPYLIGKAPWTQELVPELTRPVTTPAPRSRRDLRDTVPYLPHGSWMQPVDGRMAAETGRPGSSGSGVTTFSAS